MITRLKFQAKCRRFFNREQICTWDSIDYQSCSGSITYDVFEGNYYSPLSYLLYGAFFVRKYQEQPVYNRAYLALGPSEYDTFLLCWLFKNK